eukprot:comp22637_c0_seq1/m.34843 comp22637_c0_seq1/g.34843  ORF comp22637_c0_seq1/g.34843 comp22637_c0_seq1/m.34843 type:complete len:273 (-) comp22637_c0_seq1:1504-2322(-)
MEGAEEKQGHKRTADEVEAVEAAEGERQEGKECETCETYSEKDEPVEENDKGKNTRPGGGYDDFLAPVKAEFLAKVEDGTEAYVIDDDGAERRGRDEEGGQPTQQAKKKNRGQNKHRDNVFRKEMKDCLCPAVSNGNECTRIASGQKCVFIHDLKEFVAKKPANLGEVCPIYDAHGFCRFGASCLFSGQHTDPETFANLKDEVKMEANPPVEINRLDKDTMFTLRKNNYAFPKADAALEQLISEGLVQENKGKGKNKTPKLDPEQKNRGGLY